MSEQLKHDVMRRINRAHLWRVCIRPSLIECTILLGLVGGSTFLVSIPHILMNINTTTNHSPVDVYNYAVGSFIKTEFPVKVLLLAMLALAALIVRNIFLALGNFFARKGRLFYS